ncbi:hypothetical protein ENBRE01_2310 [Enteropsectra breve]|nr:hypothetical protein ENBRE01_2310 [Enteropsectra breve]
MERQESLLDTYTPNKIVERFQNEDDCTEELVTLIKNTPHASLNKLKMVFQSLANYDISAVLEITRSKRRPERYAATFLVLTKIKQLCRKKTNFSEIEDLYNQVFTVRSRDVDPLIRAMAVQFMSEWISTHKALHKAEYFQYIGWALNDKSDSVRRRAVRVFGKLAKTLKTNDIFARFKERLLEIAQYDVNPNIKKEACDSAVELFINGTLFTVQEILPLLESASSVKNKRKAMAKILPDGIWNLNEIHRIYQLSSGAIFKYLIFSDDKENRVESFVVNIQEFIKNLEDEHSFQQAGCYLDILKDLELNIPLALLLEILEAVKNDKRYVLLILNAVKRYNKFIESPDETAKIVAFVQELADNEREFAQPLSDILKVLEGDYEMLVKEAVSRYRYKYSLEFIKNFNICDVITGESSSIEKCYYCLWKIYSKEYYAIEATEFADTDNFIELIDFLVLVTDRITDKGFIGQLNTENKSLNEILSDIGPAINTETALMHTAAKLYALLNNAKLDASVNEDIFLHLYKLFSKGLFRNKAAALFETCSLDFLTFFTEHTKFEKSLIEGYFKALEKNPEISALAKNIALKASKHETDRYIFKLVKEKVKQTAMLDKVLLYFVPLLNQNECIVLESMAGKSKFKAACLRKSKKIVADKSVENVTFM